MAPLLREGALVVGGALGAGAAMAVAMVGAPMAGVAAAAAGPFQRAAVAKG